MRCCLQNSFGNGGWIACFLTWAESPGSVSQIPQEVEAELALLHGSDCGFGGCRPGLESLLRHLVAVWGVVYSLGSSVSPPAVVK